MGDGTNWYDNKDLFEMIQELKAQIGELMIAMERTTANINKYNGLREKLDDVERRLDVMDGKDCGNDHAWSYIFAGCGMLISISAVIVAVIK